MSLNKKLLYWLPVISALPFLLLLNQVDYSMYSTFPEFFWNDFSIILASTLGYIGAVLIFWQILLGNRFLVGKFTKNILDINKIHQNLGKYGILLIFAHPLLISYGYFQNIFWWLTIVDYGTYNDHLIFGKFAFLILVVIYVTSAFLRGKIKFRPWAYIHYLSYPLFCLVLLHAIDMGKFWQEFQLLQIFWLCLAIAFTSIILHRLYKFWGFGKYEVQLINKEIRASDILILTLKFTSGNSDNFERMYGQYVYLQSGRGKEAHPFSIMDFDKKAKTIKLGIKMLGKYTKDLENSEINKKMFMDGPYGSLMLATKQKVSKIFVAGGIGITPFVEYLKKSQDKDVLLLNCNRQMDVVLYRDELKKQLGDKYFDFISEMDDVEESNVFCCRLDVKMLQNHFDVKMIKNSQIFICGSNLFNKSIKKVFMELNVLESNINIENFG